MPDRLARAIDVLARSTIAPVALALVVLVVIGAGQGRASGRTADPTVFIVAGERFAAPELLPDDALTIPGSGYDGQFFFYLAQDPFLSGAAATRHDASTAHIDNVAYRYQRILLPLLGWAASWGDPDVLQWTLPLINLAAVLGAGLLLARLLAERGRSPWLALVFMLSIGVVGSLVRDLSDPIAVALFVIGVVWWLRGRDRLAIGALTLCLLARELYLLPVALIAVGELWAHRSRAWRWLVPLAVFGVWQLLLRVIMAESPLHGAHSPSPVPLWGAARKLKLILENDSWGVANWEVAFIGLMLLVWIGFALLSVECLRGVRTADRTREDWFAVVALGSVFVVPFLTLYLWSDIPSYTRSAAPIGAILVIAHALRPRRAVSAAMFVLMLLSLVNPIVTLLPTVHGATT